MSAETLLWAISALIGLCALLRVTHREVCNEYFPPLSVSSFFIFGGRTRAWLPVPVCSRPTRMFKMKRSIGRIGWDALGFGDIARQIGLSGINVESDQTELISAAVGDELMPISKSTGRRKWRSPVAIQQLLII